MTVVNPKSISGINSITTGSGSDNLLTIHTSDASSTERVRINSSGDVIVGSGITVSPDGDIFATGVTTSTTFVGALTGNVTGNISGGTVAGSTGTFTSHVSLGDSDELRLGAGNDLKLYHNGNNSFIEDAGTGDFYIRGADNVRIQSYSDNEDMAKFVKDGAVELYHNNIKKFDTVTTGIRVHGDEGGTAQLQLLADQGDDNPDYWRLIAETNGVLNIQDYGSGNWYNNLRLTGNTGGAELYHNNTKKFETTANGAKISGTTTAFLEITTTNGAYNPMFRGSNGDRTFDTGLRGDSGDAWCVYDVTASDNRFMIDTSGNVLIPNDNAALKFGAGNDAELYFDGTDMNIKATTNVQNVNIWTQGVKKYQFTDGMLRPLSDNSYDLGQSSLRWRNIYTGDLHCSNKGSSNDVDGTWGDYTIQEGESDLFLINNRSGKKYKFNLTEV